MKRCNNVTISPDDIQEVEDRARDLLSRLNDINFVLTPEEQQGLFSIIHALEWELIENPRTDGQERNQPRQGVPSPRLTQLLEQIKTR
jgi:hypothetical protein